MIEFTVWLLIIVSGGAYNTGTVTTVEKFKTQQQCQHVISSLPKRHSFEASCIQANILVVR